MLMVFTASYQTTVTAYLSNIHSIEHPPSRLREMIVEKKSPSKAARHQAQMQAAPLRSACFLDFLALLDGALI